MINAHYQMIFKVERTNNELYFVENKLEEKKIEIKQIYTTILKTEMVYIINYHFYF